MSNYKKTTVVFTVRGNEILLGMKKRGFGADWWNGYGGKLEPGESYKASAMRETAEESGIRINEAQLQHVADLVFRFDGVVDVVTRAYIAGAFTGEPVETEEMRPQWFAKTEIPYDTMWPGDNQWIPKILDENTSKPLGFILDFTKNNEFTAIELVNPKEIEHYF